MTPGSRWLSLLSLLSTTCVVASCSASSDDSEPYVVPYRTSGCGNGVREADEACDGVDLGGATCATVTMNVLSGGKVRCTEDCALETTECESSAGGRSGGETGTGGRR